MVGSEGVGGTGRLRRLPGLRGAPGGQGGGRRLQEEALRGGHPRGLPRRRKVQEAVGRGVRPQGLRRHGPHRVALLHALGEVRRGRYVQAEAREGALGARGRHRREKGPRGLRRAQRPPSACQRRRARVAVAGGPRRREGEVRGLRGACRVGDHRRRGHDHGPFARGRLPKGVERVHARGLARTRRPAPLRGQGRAGLDCLEAQRHHPRDSVQDRRSRPCSRREHARRLGGHREQHLGAGAQVVGSASRRG
mmetsp:Transcript_54873/g.153924  ORF Transcript_54873/g.153924 Transcript_54873/m.153924 type:complete len:251 (+) Transcript_54873:684-1436(+)